MSEYAVRLNDGRLFYVAAFTVADIAPVMEDEHGIDRSMIESVDNAGASAFDDVQVIEHNTVLI